MLTFACIEYTKSDRQPEILIDWQRDRSIDWNRQMERIVARTYRAYMATSNAQDT
jgi:hypothetical protein